MSFVERNPFAYAILFDSVMFISVPRISTTPHLQPWAISPALNMNDYCKRASLSSANITLLDSTYTMSITDMVANASVIVNATHADGKVEFNITAFDLAGNSLTVNQAQLDSPNITIDENVPSVTNLTLYSNNSNSSLARAGDLINITLEASEQIYNATLEILGTEINMTESNNIAYANISVLQNSPNGPVTFNITAYDGTGNKFNITQDAASANVIIDTANPTLSNLTIYSNNSRTDYAMAGHLLNITIPARSKAVMLNDTTPSALFSSTVTFALAVVPFTIIIDVMPNTVTFAVFRASFAVIVMFSR